MRVNARFEGEYARQMEYLTETTGMGVSEVLKASVEYYYQAMKESGQPALTNLRRFIAKQGSGRRDVSARTEELFSESVAKRARHHK
jgi:hypothetical protein